MRKSPGHLLNLLTAICKYVPLENQLGIRAPGFAHLAGADFMSRHHFLPEYVFSLRTFRVDYELQCLINFIKPVWWQSSERWIWCLEKYVHSPSSSQSNQCGMALSPAWCQCSIPFGSLTNPWQFFRWIDEASGWELALVRSGYIDRFGMHSTEHFLLVAYSPIPASYKSSLMVAQNHGVCAFSLPLYTQVLFWFLFFFRC